MNLQKWLTDIGAQLSDLEYQRFRNLLGKEIVWEFVLHDEDTWISWQVFGSHKNVMCWVLLESGHTVGFNENPAVGWSFPIKKLSNKLISTIKKYRDSNN